MEANDTVSLQRKVQEMEQKLSRLSVTVLVLIGVWLLFSPLAPGISGYDWISGVLGGPQRVVQFFLGFLFLYFAGIVKEKNHLRETLHGMVKMIKQHLEGRATSSIKEAVQILVQALGSGDAETRKKVAERLQKLTGQSLGDDKDAWESWWKSNKDTFEIEKE